MPLVSAVIPTHNRCGLLGQTLESVLGQRGVDFEVIIVDDGSSDGTGTFLRRLDDPRVTVVSHEHPQGVAAARNAGIARARGGWVAFVDDDDLWAPDKLAVQLRAAGERPGTGWVGIGAVTVDDDLRIIAGLKPAAPEDLPNLLAYNHIAGGASGTMARTELVRSVGGFDTRLSNLADWDLWIRLYLRAPLVSVYRPLVAYRRHSGSLSRDWRGVPREFEWVMAKYARVRAQRHIPANPRTLKWFARRQVRACNRLAATRLYIHLAWCHGDTKSWARAVVGSVMPGWMSRRWDRRALATLPPGWIEEAEAWLAPLRRATAAGTGQSHQGEGDGSEGR